ncbi:unnamed protein product [Cylicocyclus nassatus]|uniref:UDP-glucuronosyltransferase n=1 Tax=Cylicocyclus nassatus TaxID=53992 RepID=A0AA36H332_CYLNA|nr:unnamed protein product [Cylicocyclus nassatus]
MLGLFIGLAFLTLCSTYKIVIFAPDISNSQVGWNKRVSEELARAGHDVTVVLVKTMEGAEQDVQFSKNVKVHPLNVSTGLTRAEMEEFQRATVFGEISILNPAARRHLDQFIGMLIDGCRLTVQNKKFMQWLSDEKFDVAFAHTYHSCPIGLIHAAKIPSWVWLNSGQLMDFVARTVGVPTYASYVSPMMMDSADEMNFYERTKSLIGHIISSFMWPWKITNKETKIFREYWDPNFPDILDLAKKCPLVMVNSNELYQFPRPTLAKVVNIGGLGVEFKDAKPLKDDFKRIADLGKGMIVMSFGSVAHAEHMPAHWKTAMLTAFTKFPDYEFLVRYASDDLNDRVPPNVHLHRWLPQADLLLHPNTKAFITHGGYNSVQESISSGVPLITIALFGDQYKNARIAEKHGFAFNLRKGQVDEASIVAALNEVLTNEKYSQNAKRLSLMVRKKPVSPGQLLVKWTEFLAEFQTLDNLTPAGNNLNFFQYFSLDVIAVRRCMRVVRKEKKE